jgi:hypothetical protein
LVHSPIEVHQGAVEAREPDAQRGPARRGGGANFKNLPHQVVQQALDVIV